MLGAGYVGGEVAGQARARGDEVVLADNWYATERAQLDGLDARVETYRRSRAALLDCLPQGGLDRFAPVDGAFYLYADVSLLTEDSQELCASLLEATGVGLEHVGSFSFDPAVLRGNIEGFSGVAQVPLGFAGPLLVDGEHAYGEFFVPMATTEGTLVASYGRGMRLTREAGGIKTTVVDDAMQRAPLFVFRDARAARAFLDFIERELRGHIADEEDALLPRARHADAAAAQRILAEHRELLALSAEIARALEAGSDLRSPMAEAGQLLDDHVRYEERHFFEAVQRALPAADLDEIGRAIEASRAARGVAGPACARPGAA